MTPDLRAAIEWAEEYLIGRRGVSTTCLRTLLDAVKELERDAKRWSGFWEASPIYLREDLVSAKTGELVRGRKRFVIYVDLPDRALLETAIDAALAKEQP